jgi:hypothetical protein
MYRKGEFLSILNDLAQGTIESASPLARATKYKNKLANGIFVAVLVRVSVSNLSSFSDQSLSEREPLALN